MVWDLCKQEWVMYRRWMRWCPWINTKGMHDED
jgi:hypothetical protein